MIKKLLPAFLSAALVSGCATSGSGSAAAPIDASLPAASLSGHSFMWEGGVSEACELPPSITFTEEGRIAGQAGCNRILGAWKQEGQRLDLGNIGATMRLCAPAFMEVERKFLDLLNASRYATQAADGEGIDLWDETGKKVVTLVPERAGRCE